MGVFVEMCRHPAADRVADELFGRNEESETDENSDGCAMIHTIDVVVIASRFGIRHCAQSHHFQQLIHSSSLNSTRAAAAADDVMTLMMMMNRIIKSQGSTA